MNLLHGFRQYVNFIATELPMVIIGAKEGGAPLLLLIIALHTDFATLWLFSLCVFIITIQSLPL